MSLSALLPLAVAISLAGSPGGSRLASGIPLTRAPLPWGAAVMETLQRSVQLQPIRVEDLAGAASVASGAASATAVAPARAQLAATYATPARATVPYIQRDLGRLWRLTVPASAHGPTPRVTATVESLRGEPGKLSLVGHEEISIPVLLLENAPVVRADTNGTTVLEGGFALQIPSSALERAGSYGGRLVLRTEGY